MAFPAGNLRQLTEMKRRSTVKSMLRYKASARGGLHPHGEGIGSEAINGSAEAHERAVMTVKLTLLLLIIGIALFFSVGLNSGHPVGPKRVAPARSEVE
jgi:hypothetical protein